MPVSEKERQQINSLVARFEADTGAQAVAAVVGKADAYPEIPWKAYAIGTALGALAAALHPFVLPAWSASYSIALDALVILGAGAAFAAAATLLPAVGRLFLDRLRAQAEARQYALAMFLDREIFRTADRRAVLILLTEFERIAVIVPDTGLAVDAPAAELERISGRMRSLLLRRNPVAAFEAALDGLKALIAARGRGVRPSDRNALEDAVVMEKGA